MNHDENRVYTDQEPVSVYQQKYLQKLQKHKKQITAARILIFALFLLLWEAAVRLGWIDGFIFSSPSRLWNTFRSMWKDGSIFLHTGVTLTETLISFALVVLIGITMAVLLWYNDTLSEILEPYLVVLNSLPKSALAPLLIVWLGANRRTVIVAGISVALFGTVLNLYTSFKEMEADKIKLIYTLHGTKKDVLFKVVLPGTLPLLISIMKVNIGLCLVGVVIGEFIGARQGLGYLIIYGSQVFKLDWVILSIVILCIIAAALYALLSLLEKKASR
ncbi:MAG: ABC transporter permease [Clostridiales bacterium]|nr:ABC transporter permease [Clostridiales bacterium]